ncbi:TPA: hypothetical protein VDA67_000525 [Burkholderia vietnamiensis]|nr:hypothetical protein [Burkholderia vietnamiensis]HEP6282219.1 hypothetical protein [Burkholderia vietnamiensis]HEP6307201.1 hypothetical protein [Burkholderia vietnamiensis]
MSKKFTNSKKSAHLAAIPEFGLESENNDLATRCKFNFSYFCSQDRAGKGLGELEKTDLTDLLSKLVDFSRLPLSYWKKQKHGKGSTLAIYKNFPSLSDFTHPKHVPHDVHWGRFRLAGEIRLAGFVVPTELDGIVHQPTNVKFDCNTFYVVFIDHNHGFYKTEI